MKTVQGDLGAQREAAESKFFGRKIKAAGGTMGKFTMAKPLIMGGEGATTEGAVGGKKDQSSYQGRKAGGAA